ncbi:MAG: hypothetical protein EXS12_09475, partial [Phycisphaerales bacterium]|nr:hypothetical protein [Phycisphaerales bacterium]
MIDATLAVGGVKNYRGMKNAPRRGKSARTQFSRGYVAFLITMAAVLSGCQNELFQDAETPYTAPSKRLHEVGTFNPIKESSETPETLQQVEKNLAADKLPKQEVNPTRKLSLAECRSAALERNLDLKVQLYVP